MIVLLQISARSFHDELHNAIHSVERGFGHLLSDVVVDVTDTLHCTISAVEHVLVLNGLMRNKSIYSDKCRHVRPRVDLNVPDDDNPLTKFYRTREEIENRGIDRGGKIHESIFKLNKTLSDAFDKHTSRHKIDDISKVLKDETDQLNKVSNILRNELHSISRNVKSNYDDYSPTHRALSEMEGIGNSENNAPPENYDLRKSRVDIPYKNTNQDTVGSNSNKIKNLFDETENSNKILLADVKHNFESIRDGVGNYEQDFPRKINDETNIIQKEKNKLQEQDSIFNINNYEDNRFSPFFDPDEYSEPRKKVYHDALSIIQGSQHNDRVLNDLFKTSHAATDVFAADPDVMKF
ncbi:unnamed protein product [Leptidea sinapis]|uniref:Uncharacterized protein n=1 Tax=Leptidea sinapis TaxID=189913 RepID=A0A5E4QWD2_9NEOP|nr:unnamed protein product [Leptidea sinapis]